MATSGPGNRLHGAVGRTFAPPKSYVLNLFCTMILTTLPASATLLVATHRPLCWPCLEIGNSTYA